MKHINIKFAQLTAVVALAAVISSCGKEEKLPDPVAAVSEETVNIVSSDTESSATFTLSTNQVWVINISTEDGDDSWIGVSPRTGKSGDNTITVTTASSGLKQRRATLTILAGNLTKTVAVTQEAVSGIRKILMNFHKSTGGSSWKKSDNWCTDKAIGTWYGLTVDDGGNLTGISMKGNNLTGHLPEDLCEITTLKTLELGSNKMIGSLPSSIGSLTNLTTLDIEGNSFSGALPESMNDLRSLTNLNIQYNYFYSVIPSKLVTMSANKTLSLSYNPQYGIGQLFIEYDTEGQGTHEEGEVVQYQKATKGDKGYNLFITGDGFVRKNNSVGGTAERIYNIAAEALFANEPFTSLRDYFNIYIIYSQSNERGVTIGDYSVDNRFRTFMKTWGQRYAWTSTSGVTNFVKESMTAAGYDVDMTSTMSQIILAVHSTLYGGIASMSEDGASIGICLTDGSFKNVLQHECGGHGIAKLTDEYVSSSDASSFPVGQAKWYQEKQEWYMNVAFSTVHSEVPWGRFLDDGRYKGKVDLVEGAYYRSTGAWRPSTHSIMRDYYDGWNVPSRLYIYKNVLKTAVSDFVYDYETFVAFDEPVRTASSLSLLSAGNVEERPQMEMLPPPVDMNNPWLEEAKHNQ